MKKFTLLLLLCFYVKISYCQEYAFVNYDVAQGLSGATVYNILQDKEGFIWFSTESGISRFDGVHFKQFTIADGLPDNEVLKLFCDSRNRLWIMPFKNDICYISNGKVFSGKNDTILSRLQLVSDIIDVKEDREGNILIQEHTQSHIITTSNQLITYNKLPENVSMSCFTIAAHPQSGFFVTSRDKRGLLVYHLNHGSFRLVKVYKDLNPSGIGKVAINRHWFIYKKGDVINVISNKTNVQYEIPYPSGFNSISLLDEDKFTINTRTAAILYSNKGAAVADTFLLKRNINCSFIDKEGNYWFGTLRNGVYKLISTAFTNVFERNTPIHVIRKIDGLLWVGSDNSTLFTIDPKKIQVKQHILSSIYTSRILDIKKDTVSGKIWLGGDDGIFYNKKSISADNKTFVHLPFMKSRYAVKSIALQNKEVYICTNVNTQRISGIDSNFETVLLKRSTVCQIRGELLYIGTLNGVYLCRRDNVNSKWEVIVNPTINTRVSDIQTASDGCVWVATQGAGIFIYKRDSLLHHLTEKDGLNSNTCNTLCFAPGEYWIGTIKGLNKITINKNTYQYSSYNKTDGLPEDEITTLHKEGNCLYIGTAKSLTIFDLNKFQRYSHCKLVLDDIIVAGKNISKLSFFRAEKKDNLRFSFVAISLRSPSDIKYCYRLSGLQTHWDTSFQQVITYPALPSGYYELQVFAINKSGFKSNTINVPFEVVKSFYETLWFKLLSLVLILCIMVAVIIVRGKYIQKREAEKNNIRNRIAELEQMAFRSQMNPHFIFNSLNSIQDYVIQKDISAANKFISKFSSLIRQTLNNSSKQKIPFADELEYLTTYLELEKIRMEDSFKYQIEMNESFNTGNFVIPPMLVQPFIENAIRHGLRYRNDQLGVIRLLISETMHHLIIHVEDNGVGRKMAKQYQGFSNLGYTSKGMSLTSNRIELMNQDIENNVNLSVEDILNEHGQILGTKVALVFSKLFVELKYQK